MNDEINLTPGQKLFYRVWSDRSGCPLSQILRAVVISTLYKDDPSHLDEALLEEGISLEQMRKIRDTRPDWSGLTIDPTPDPSVSALIAEALNEPEENQ